MNDVYKRYELLFIKYNIVDDGWRVSLYDNCSLGYKTKQILDSIV